MRWRILALSVPFLTATTLRFHSNRLLDRGIIAGPWSAFKLDSARAFLSARSLKSLMGLITWAAMALLVFSLFRHQRNANFNGMRAKLRESKPARPWIDWSNLAPLRSEYWGQQPVDRNS